MYKRYRSELRSHGQPVRLSLRSLQRKKRIFGLPGIIAPATTSTTITMTSSIFPSQCCPHHQTASAQLTSSCREGKFDIGVGKHLGGESLDRSALAPGVQRQTGFAAGLLQKSFPVPTVFDG